jgi:hypothetical protein
MNAFYGKHFGCHRKKEQQQVPTASADQASGLLAGVQHQDLVVSRFVSAGII